jgi:SynChlorMet cassette protein ScmD
VKALAGTVLLPLEAIRMSLVSPQKFVANPRIVLREEYDDWALLFDADSGEIFGLNPTGVFVWKLFDGKHEITDVVEKLRKECEGVPDTAVNEVDEFATDLVNRGFVGLEK